MAGSDQSCWDMWRKASSSALHRYLRTACATYCSAPHTRSLYDVRVCGADQYVAQSRFHFGARWNCEVLRHISVRLQRAQELHDIRLSGPAPGRLARSASIERRQSPLLGCEIGLCIDVGGVERYVAEPSADRVDVDPGLQPCLSGWLPIQWIGDNGRGWIPEAFRRRFQSFSGFSRMTQPVRDIWSICAGQTVSPVRNA